ncbi:MAG: ABC transporter permease [Bacteroidota bacterium]
MLQNYLLATLRSVTTRKGFSLLNIVGLAIGLSASLLILQYVKDELSYDDFHAHRDRIYRVRFDAYRNGLKIFECATAFPRVAPMLKAEFPEVATAITVFIAFATVSYQSAKAAFTNPVTSLRYE